MLLKTTRISHLTPSHFDAKCREMYFHCPSNPSQYLNTERLGESLDARSVELPVGQIPRTGSENLRVSVVLQFVLDVQMSFRTKSIWFLNRLLYGKKSPFNHSTYLRQTETSTCNRSECVSATTKLHLKRINTLSSVKQNWCWNKLKN